MAFCSKCGTQIEDGKEYCAACDPANANQNKNQYQNQYQQAGAQQAAPEVFFPKADVEAGKVIAILMYIFPFLFFLPLVSDPKTAYGKFHANNALLILFMYVIASILVWTFIIPAVLWTAAFVYQILGIISPVKGSTKPLPLIGSLVLIK